MAEILKNIQELKEKFSALSKCERAFVVPCSRELRDVNLKHIQKNRSAHWVIAEDQIKDYKDQALFIAVPISKGQKEIYAGVITGQPKRDQKNGGKYIIPVSYLNSGQALCTVTKNSLVVFYTGTSPQSVSPVPIKNWKLVRDTELLVSATKYRPGERKELNKLLEDKSLNETEKRILILARIGQGKFRENVLSRAGGRCEVTGFDSIKLLLASHILPWASCEASKQRLDANNGLLLTPNLDRLFDRGLIGFSNGGEMLSKTEHLPALRALAPSVFEMHYKLREKPNLEQQKYLEKHREMYKLRDALNALVMPIRESRTKLKNILQLQV